MDMYRIPFNHPYLAGREASYMAQAAAGGRIAGDGAFTKQCSALIEELLRVPKALLTTSCTHALEMAAILLDIRPGDEVIVPSFTFVSTVNAFILRGASPVFVDIRPDTLNVDETKLAALITERTKAILVVHYAGVGCEMDEILSIANRFHIPVIEDNAHGLFASYRNKYLGTFGCMATQSFHETKNFTCGEGGALILNDRRLIERAEIVREKGTDRSRFFRGQVDKYTWVDLGSSYLPSDLLAAFLFAQLEDRTFIQEKRRKIWQIYSSELVEWASEQQVQLPTVPAYCEQSFHMFHMQLPTQEHRSEFISRLRDQGILSVFHYVPLHLSPMGRKYGYGQGDLPVSEQVSDRLVRLPFYTDLSLDDQMYVIEVVRSVKF